jgi:hypothetical protein
MDYTKLLEQSPEILFAILIAGVLFLIAPASVLGRMSLNDFWLRPYIGIVTIVAASLLLMHGAGYLVGRIEEKWKKKKEQEGRERSELEILRAFTPEERRALQPYILEKKNSAAFHISDGVAGGLVAKTILFMASNVGPYSYFQYNLQPWAREQLTRHSELLEISESDLALIDKADQGRSN